MRVQASLTLSLLTLAVLSGCGRSEPVFVLNTRTQELVRDARTPVEKALLENFGTPNQLVGWEAFPVDYGADGSKLKQGRNLYMVHCLHCHGVSGDGDGPTAKFLNPRPRDYRQGVFKFTSTLTGLKPSRHDLRMILEEGIPGTYMPSFTLLPDEDLDAIVEYVRWLSIRREYEIKLVNEMAGFGGMEKEIRQRVADGRKQEDGETREQILKDLNESITDEFPDLVESVATDLAELWARAEEEDAVVTPKVARTEPSVESLARGKDLYNSKKAKCLDCHGPTGRGDGALTEDFWDVPNTNPAQKYPVSGLHDMWGQPQQPRNLTRGIYRGGRRPVDLYRRIYAGIKGTQMPAFGGTVLTDEEIWDIVNYVMSLPFEGKASAYPASPHAAEGDKVVSSKPGAH